jgi:two-component system KDP operon response regulator KdpE
MSEASRRAPAPPTVLVVDAEPRLHRLVKLALAPGRFEVVGARDPDEALDLAVRQPPALVVLEMRQPRGDGVDLCRRLRALVGEVAVIFLAADAGDEAKVAGLRCGDDYVTKPFSLVELLARVQAVLRRARPAPPAGPTFDDGLLLIDLDARRVRFGGVEVALTPTEYALLEHLVVNRGRVLLHEDLLTRVWGGALRDDSHLLRLHIANLRKKIEPDPAHPRYIHTLRGLGYRFEPRPAEPSPPPQTDRPPSTISVAPVTYDASSPARKRML